MHTDSEINALTFLSCVSSLHHIHLHMLSLHSEMQILESWHIKYERISNRDSNSSPCLPWPLAHFIDEEIEVQE